MDHEVIPYSSKVSNWPLNLSWHQFGLHQEKDVWVTMELEVPKRSIFRPTLSIVMVQQVLWWERQKRLSCCKMSRDHGIDLSFFLSFHTHTRAHTFPWLRGKKGRGSNMISPPPELPSLNKCKSKKSTHPLSYAWSLLLVHIWFTLG